MFGPLEIKMPLQLHFKMLLTDEMVKLITKNTNLYFAEKFRESSALEFDCFVATLFFIRVFKCLSIDVSGMLWKQW